MAIPYAEIKNAFTVYESNRMKGTSSWIEYDHYYPDFDFSGLRDLYNSRFLDYTGFDFKLLLRAGFELISTFHESFQIADFFPNHADGEFDFSLENHNAIHANIPVRPLLSSMQSYVYDVICKFSEIELIFRKLKDRAEIDYSYDITYLLQTFACRAIDSRIIECNFDVITYENYQELGYEKSDIGMAVINDNKGARYKTKLGKAIGILYPKVPKSLIGYMVEAIKESQEEYTQELYVHEGFSREHFRYGYMKATTNDKSPAVRKPTTMSLVGSCMRSQVLAPEIGINHPNQVHLSGEVFETGIHPAEAYASGDFSIVYISDKEDPFDPTGKVLARSVVTHYQIDRDRVAALRTDHRITDKPVVNISPVYITSKINEVLMFEYLEDKYSYKTLGLTTRNHDIFKSLKDNYNLTKPQVKNVMIRYPRLLAISMQGDMVNVNTLDVLKSSMSSMSLIAPYLDRDSEFKAPVMVLSDERSECFDNTVAESNDQIYCYLLPYGEYNSSMHSVTTYFSGYHGYNSVRIPKFRIKCDISGEMFNSDQMRKVIYLNGTETTELTVNLTTCEGLGYASFRGYYKRYLVKSVAGGSSKWIRFRTIRELDIGNGTIYTNHYEVSSVFVEEMIASGYFYKYKNKIYESELVSRKQHLMMIRAGYKENS